MNIHTRPGMTIDEFFSLARAQQAKAENARIELMWGTVRTRPFVKLNHTRITNRLLLELASKLDETKFEVANSEFAVQTGPTSIRFADVMVMPSGKDGSILSADDAVILFEVLSQSTRRQDFGEKKQEYQALNTLKAYVVVAQDEPMVWLWTRDKDGTWIEKPRQISNGKLVLEAVNVTIKLNELYRGIT